MEASPPDPGSLVVLPEMFGTGFSMNVDGIAEPTGCGPAAKFLASIARDFQVWVVGGLVEKAPTGPGRNMAVGYGPDGLPTVRYQKMKTFTPGGETKHYEPGNASAEFDWPPLKCGVFICYDLRFPELFTPLARTGVGLYLIIANWPWMRTAHWVTLLQARAIENQAYVAGVNRCGEDPHFRYSGRTLIVDPKGAILADAGESESMISAEINPDFLKQYRADFPVLGDR